MKHWSTTNKREETIQKIVATNAAKRVKFVFSAEIKQKMSDSKKGNKHPRWIEDRTKVINRFKESLSTTQYRNWRSNIFKRDNWKCCITDTNCSGQLEAHHILNWSDYPELRYEINNGITLCHAHHPRGRKKENELSPYFMELLKLKK